MYGSLRCWHATWRCASGIGAPGRPWPRRAPALISPGRRKRRARKSLPCRTASDTGRSLPAARCYDGPPTLPGRAPRTAPGTTPRAAVACQCGCERRASRRGPRCRPRSSCRSGRCGPSIPSAVRSRCPRLPRGRSSRRCPVARRARAPRHRGSRYLLCSGANGDRRRCISASARAEHRRKADAGDSATALASTGGLCCVR